MNQQNFLFTHDDSLMYNLHFEVLNSKDFGVPQNRERVFLIGIRNDLPNNFRFPTGFRLTKRLKDILESELNEKYYLSDKMLAGFANKGGDFGERFNPKSENDIANCITARYAKMAITDNYIIVKEATKKGFAIARTGDSINLQNPKSETRRGRVGDQIANTISTINHQAVLDDNRRIRRLTPLECFRLQGFPDDYIKPCSDSQTYKQSGNSITVSVMQAIIKNLLPILQHDSRRD